jgi:hypothetical protein
VLDRVVNFIIDFNNNDLTDEALISRYGIESVKTMEQIGAFLSAEEVNSVRLKRRG